MAVGIDQDKRARQATGTLRGATNAAKPARVNILNVLMNFTVVLLTAAVAKIACLVYFSPALLPESKRSTITSAPHIVAAVKAPKHPERGDQQFKHAMTRLQDDLYSMSEDQSDVVRQVNAKSPGLPRPCPLEWINGEAALSLDSNGQRLPPSLTSAVTQCAVAVEKYRDEKEAALRAADPSAQ
jgi:hypothetical protein